MNVLEYKFNLQDHTYSKKMETPKEVIEQLPFYQEVGYVAYLCELVNSFLSLNLPMMNQRKEHEGTWRSP